MTTLAKALKEKNKLKLEISLLQRRLTAHNSVIKGNPRPFDLKIIDNELSAKIEELVLAKAALTKANMPVQEKIYRLAEMKGLIAFYKKLPAIEGKHALKYSNDSAEYEVFFNEAVISEKIKTLEKAAELIQDELETFNHITNI